MDTLFAVKFAYLIPLLPLLGAAVAGLLGSRFLRQQSHWPIWIGVGVSAVLSIILLAGTLRLWDPEGQHGDYEQQEKWQKELAAQIGEKAARAQRPAKLYIDRTWYTWIEAGPFKAAAGAFLDPLAAVMLCIVTGIGFLITVYSKGYMAGEAGYFRFFAYLGLFIFMMTVLVMSNNFLMLYLGWEGVGLCSYLLIGYYYQRPAAREAAKKAFLVNRIGDFGFALGIMLIFLIFGRVDFFGPDMEGVLIKVTDASFIGRLSPWMQDAVHWIPFLLMLGAFGKSAQFPLYVWLPDAMEGPTPVSALIHAATMVTAGVYMIVRCSTLFIATPASLATIAVIGAFTALLAATIALRQFDLKKVFAYSTISQLGFMFVGAAVLAPVAAIFHLLTHAFFKALLFLSSGVVMHAMDGELDMRRMSGLKRILPWTNRFILAGCLALAGFPFFSGYFSKDEIVSAALEQNWVLGLALLVAAFMTAYYTFRLYFRVFLGPEMLPAAPAEHAPAHPPADPHAHASASAVHTGTAAQSGVDRHLASPAHEHEEHSHEPLSMMLPLALLALGAFAAGYLNWPFTRLGGFLGQSPSFLSGYVLADVLASRTHGNAHPIPFGQHALDTMGIAVEHPIFTAAMGIGALVSIAGILVAYVFHLKERARAEGVARRYPRLVRLLEARFWVDEVYQAAIVQPLRRLGQAFFEFDQYVVDGIVWTVGFVPQLFGFGLRLTTQRGSLQGYALTMLGSIAIILLILLLW